MEILTTLISVDLTVLTIFDYRMSFIELVGIVTGLLSVYFATRMSFLTWSIGLINVGAFFCLFYQVQLYSDMALQVFFAALTIYGWSSWNNSEQRSNRPGYLSASSRALCAVAVLFMTATLAVIVSNLHTIMPSVFVLPCQFPVQDAFTAATSIVATLLLARKQVESWVLWVVVDVVSIYLYWARGIPFMGALYFVFMVVALFGLLQWVKIAHETNTNR